MRAAKYAARIRFILARLLKYRSFALPLEFLCETPTLLAFHYLTPACPLHVLLVPKKSVANLSA